MLEIRNPYNKDLLASVAMDSEEEAFKKLDKAEAAWKKKKEYPRKDRIELLRNFKRLVEKDLHEIALKATKEGGKPLRDSLVEINRAISGIDWTISSLAELKGQQVPMSMNDASEHHLAYTKREAKGVVFSISAFNHPFNLLIHQVLPALAVGCPVILKPSLSTPLSAIVFVELLEAAGIKSGWCQLLICEDAVTAKIAASKKISFMSFIGSQKVGWQLKRNLYPGVSCNLEHGGTAPAIVDETADIELAAKQLSRSSFYHAGQVCVSTQNIFLHKNIKHDFKKIFLEEVKALKVGNPELITTDIGPIIKQSAYKRILAWIDEAKSEGAEVLVGGKAFSDTTIEATILENPNFDSKVFREEIFGPVVNIVEFEDLAQLIELLNSSDFSFQASFYTESLAKSMKTINDLDVKTLLINEKTAFRVDWMPFGGRKLSGHRTGGMLASMLDMTEEKLIIIRDKNIIE